MLHELQVTVRYTLTKIPKFFFLIPATLLLMLAVVQPLLYIHELNLTISPPVLLLIMIYFTLFWLDRRPSRHMMPLDFFTQLTYYLFPVSALFFFFFLQNHFWLGLVLLISLVFITVVFTIRLYKAEKSTRQIVRQLTSFVISLFATVLFFPGIYEVMNGIDTPHYEANSELLIDIITEAENVPEYNDSGDGVQNYSPVVLNRLQQDIWIQLSTEARLDTLQTFIGEACLRLGVPPEEIPSVQAEIVGVVDEHWILFNPEAKQITIDIRQVENSNPTSLIKTGLHQAYHVFQRYIVDSVNWDDAITQTALFNDARVWQAEIADSDSSRKQLESDAWEWCSHEMSLLKLYL